MADLVIGMNGNHINLESMRHLIALADFLVVHDGASVSSNLSYIGFTIDEAEVKWDAVMA